jgi:hypothetical protein
MTLVQASGSELRLAPPPGDGETRTELADRQDAVAGEREQTDEEQS